MMNDEGTRTKKTERIVNHYQSDIPGSDIALHFKTSKINNT